MKHRFLAGLGTVSLLTCVCSSAFAQDEDLVDRTPQDCISTDRINYTRIIDESTVLFYMVTGTVYRNILPQNCVGLDRRDGFVYSVRNGRLCDVDPITTRGLGPGRPCTLGEFLPISREEARMLQRDPDALDAIDRSVEVEQVELPPEGEAQGSETAQD